MSAFTDAFERNRYDLRTAINRSRTWFEQQAILLKKQGIEADRLIRTSQDKNVQRIVPGNMYLFEYYPKMEADLPYYDTYPLVFPFRRVNDGFIGLNMHYLPYQARIVLLNRLMDFRTDAKLTENTKLNYSWATITGISKYKMAEQCVKRYLSAHIQSPIKKIDSIDWVTALMLPVEGFTKASKQKVWAETT